MLEEVPKLKLSVKNVENEYVIQCGGFSVCIKKDRYYTRRHMWAKKISELEFKVGVTDYVQKILKEKVALIEIYKNVSTGNKVEAGEVFGTIYGSLYANLDIMRCEYMAFDLTAPVSGEIVNVNQEVMNHPRLINESPYEKGWIAIIAADLEGDLEDLISPLKYRKLLERKEECPFRII